MLPGIGLKCWQGVCRDQSEGGLQKVRFVSQSTGSPPPLPVVCEPFCEPFSTNQKTAYKKFVLFRNLQLSPPLTVLCETKRTFSIFCIFRQFWFFFNHFGSFWQFCFFFKLFWLLSVILVLVTSRSSADTDDTGLLPFNWQHTQQYAINITVTRKSSLLMSKVKF